MNTERKADREWKTRMEHEKWRPHPTEPDKWEPVLLKVAVVEVVEAEAVIDALEAKLAKKNAELTLEREAHKITANKAVALAIECVEKQAPKEADKKPKCDQCGKPDADYPTILGVRRKGVWWFHEKCRPQDPKEADK